MTATGSHRALGLVTMILAVVVCVLVLSGVYRKPFERGGTTVKALFASTQQLHSGDDVRVDGVKVGRVDSVELQDDRRSVLVGMTIEDDAVRLYRDATASVRWKTLLGASFYVDIKVGDRRTGPLDDTPIPIEHTSGQVELEDVTSTLRGGAMTGVQTMPRELAAAFADERLPGLALDTFADVAPSVTDAANALRGQFVDKDLQDLVTNTGRALAALDTPGDRLRRVVSGLSATVGVTARRQAEIRSAIARSPALTRDTDTTLARLDATLGLADPLLDDLVRPAPDVAPTLAALRPTLVDADRLLGRARPLLRALRPATSALATASRRGLPLLDQLAPSLRRLETKVLPYMGAIDPQTDHSASQMIGPALAGLGSGGGAQVDNASHFIRFPATVGSSSLYFPCQTYIANPDAEQIVACNTLEQMTNAFLGYDPLGASPAEPHRRKGRR